MSGWEHFDPIGGDDTVGKCPDCGGEIREAPVAYGLNSLAWGNPIGVFANFGMKALNAVFRSDIKNTRNCKCASCGASALRCPYCKHIWKTARRFNHGATGACPKCGKDFVVYDNV